MTPEPHLVLELEPSEAFTDTTKTLVLPWSGQSVTIRVPAGVLDATMMRLPGLGPAGADGAPQDAFVQVRIKTVPAQFAPPPQFGPPPPQFGPGQPGAYPPPPITGSKPAAHKKSLLIGAVGLVLVLLLCCGLPLSFFFLNDEEDKTTGSPGSGVDATPAVVASPSAVPVSAEQYQAALATADTVLKAGFDKLGKAKNPKAVRDAATELQLAFFAQRKTLSEMGPPEPLTVAHTSLIDAFSAVAGSLSDASSAAGSSEVCIGPSAVARVSRDEAADKLWAAVQALATADPARPYTVGSFMPKETKDGNNRPRNGTFVKRTRGGLGELKIENGGADTVLNLVKSGSKTPAISVFVRSKNKFTVKGIKDGTYTIFMTSGKDWNTKFKAFSRGCDFQKFDDSFKFTTGSSTYTIWSITLTPVIGGNASSSDVDPDDFPAN